MRRALFAMSPREATFARRGFTPGTPETVAHLERIGQMFLAGYNVAVTHLDDARAYCGCLRIVRDHDYRLPKFGI